MRRLVHTGRWAVAGLLLTTGARAAAASGGVADTRIATPVRAAPETPGDDCPSSGSVPLAGSGATGHFSQLQQPVAALKGGGFAAVWVQVGPRSGVRLHWLDRAGEPLTPEGGREITGGSGTYEDAVIAPHATSGAYVAFAAGDDVIVQRFDVEGRPLWPGEGIAAVDRSFGQYALYPHLVADAVGDVFVCFQFFGVGPRLDIRCQRFDGTGQRLWSNAGASAADGGNDELRVVPRGVSDGAGGLLLFWRNQREIDGSAVGPMLMEGQHFGPDGRRLWGPAPKVIRSTRLAPDNGYTFKFFQVVTDGSGGAVLAFNDWVADDPALDVVAQRVSEAGELLWGSGAVVTAAPGPQQHDQTIASGDGGAFVAVFELVNDSHNRLRLFRLGPDGRHLWSPDGILVSDPGATALDYGLFGSYEGEVLRLAWTHQAAPAAHQFGVAFATCSPGGLISPRSILTTYESVHLVEGAAWSGDLGATLAVWDEGAVISESLLPGGAIVRDLAPCGPFRRR